MTAPGPLVVVADDDEDILSFLTPSFEAAGLRVVEAHNGLEALRAVTEHEPDVVVLDIGMPHLDGRAVLRILQKMGPRAPLVLFLTAHALPENRIEGLELGAVDYIVKPFDTGELLARVATALRTRRRIEAAAGC